MRKKKTRGNALTRSWREIRQTANRRVVTAHARRRIRKSIFRGILVFTTIALSAAGVYYGIGYWEQGVQKMNTALPAQPLRGIVFSTDGVLSKEWVEGVLDLPEEADIMSIDIHGKKLLLEAKGQVKSAVIRRLPEKLRVDLRERDPVVRVATRNEEGRVVPRLVDREGYVYRGRGYDAHEISSLLFLGGVNLQRSADGFRPLSGIEQIDELLQIARAEFPELFRSWRVVDFGDPPLIKVRSEDFREIVFGPDGHREQLQWLAMIVENNRRQMAGMQERVDLSLGNQVVVR